MIKIQNIYYMLAYAFQVLRNEGYSRLSAERFSNAQDLLAAILSIGISSQIKRGIHRDYFPNEELLDSPRGKIDISTSISKHTFLQKKLYCEYNIFSENTYLNQILKSTMLSLCKKPNVKSERRKSLKKLLFYFENVGTINISKVNWNTIPYQRNNHTYKMLVNICHLVHQGFNIDESLGDNKMRVFSDTQQMSQLYEKFILEYYKKHFPQLSPKASYIDWNTDNGIIELLPRMKTDTMLLYDNKILIIDAKYYNQTLQSNNMYDSKTLHSNNLYQIFTYVKNKDIERSGNVSGLLLYAKSTEGITLNNEYKFSGNKVLVMTLDLNCNFTMIANQLDEIIYNWIGSTITRET